MAKTCAMPILNRRFTTKLRLDLSPHTKPAVILAKWESSTYSARSANLSPLPSRERVRVCPGEGPG